MTGIENLVVAAHQGDIPLWFSSVLRKPHCGIIVCWRKSSLKDTTDVFGLFRKYREKLGIPVVWLEAASTANPRVFGRVAPETNRNLAINLESFFEMTNPERVYTHNPWGEYGHSNHILLHEVVRSLRRDLVFRDCVVTNVGYGDDEAMTGKRPNIARMAESYAGKLSAFETASPERGFKRRLVGWHKAIDHEGILKRFDGVRDYEERFVRYK